MYNDEILIISYTFPPAPGIGGRRWAKFAKYLANQNYKVYIITSENITKEESLWSADVKHKNIVTHEIPRKYPSIFLKETNSLLDRIKFRGWKYFLTLVSQGTVFERTFFWKKQLLNKAIEIIDQHKIVNVVITVPPFRLAYYGSFLKNKRPGINLIVDFRDPWTNNRSFHGFKDISMRRFRFEKRMELKVLALSDKVVTVSSNTTEYLKNELKIHTDKFFTIPNGFDPDDVNIRKTDRLNDKVTFIYTGTLYSNLEYVIYPLLDFLVNLKKVNSVLYAKLNFEFYGSYGINLKQEIADRKLDCFLINSEIPLENVFEKLISADYCLLFAAPDHGFALNTKFYEYLACRKPIILFAPLGDASSFIENNQLGKCICPETLDEDLMNLLKCIDEGRFVFNSAFEIDQFSINRLVELVKVLFKP